MPKLCIAITVNAGRGSIWIETKQYKHGTGGLTMSENKMEMVAEMLGVELGEAFSVKELPGHHLYRVTKSGFEVTNGAVEWSKCRDLDLFLRGAYTVKRIDSGASEREADIIPMPSPCVRIGDKNLNDCTDREWFLKIAEEIFEAVEASIWEKESPDLYEGAFAAEMIDVITVCRSYLHARGYDGTKLKNLVMQVDDSNRERGRL